MALIALASIAVLVLGYRFYGAYVARQYALDDARVTPAVARQDGVDFVPASPFYLLGQHFSAISAAGPIAGPILACMAFGWLPSLLWIALGCVLIGAVHDFSALVASVRHNASSVAHVLREHVGKRAWLAMMIFIWIALAYVLVAFADITANTFVGKTEELEGIAGAAFNPGGAVAAAAVLYLTLAITMGLVERFLAPRLWVTTVIFVPATLGAVWLGTEVSTLLLMSARSWALTILAYSVVAALLPVWLLLQPRGYLGGFVLYITLAVGVIGILFGGADIAQPAIKTWSGPKLTDAMFPFLFVTIACGACSGFHGLVCSGTTSKQIGKESHCKPVGYGAMLLEGLVAVIALGTIMFVADGELAGRGPGRIFGDGIGRFIALLVGAEHQRFAATFGAMAFSTFVFDTLDVTTRLGRYILEELFGTKSRTAGLGATLATALVPALFIVGSAPAAPGQPPSYMLFWTLFGTANQLLAALTLLGVTAWLYKTGRKILFVALPMCFVMTMTLWSLVAQIGAALRLPIGLHPGTFNGITAVLMLALALFLIAETARAARRTAASPIAPAAG